MNLGRDVVETTEKHTICIVDRLVASLGISRIMLRTSIRNILFEPKLVC